MSDLIKQLNWRYATKKFDATKKLTSEQLSVLTEALRLAPSSFGLQPWGFVVVTDPAIRAQLKDAAWGQTQVTDASELIVLCRKAEFGEKDVIEFVQDVASKRGVPAESLAEYQEMMVGSVTGMSKDELSAWMAKQVYIALGVLLTAAAIENIDACPMEGFDNSKFDEILGLKEQGLSTCAICPVGFRAADDEYANYKKVRYSAEKVIFTI
ncbi:MAG: NAD(P)H-dependent oxidoreductase [Candidatus Pacebacteria bacterium CG10_big_fil_rev_8_21_14_0_10_42_12]|nr:MAG: NAD(P)H-dependent oxidoreductase [Candidatus Pacebacteria bacterium CG10_big_fil_rev_8_21_14_0_10_42_12]